MGGLATASNKATGGVNKLGASAGKMGRSMGSSAIGIGKATLALAGLTVGLAGVTKWITGGISSAATLGRTSSALGKLLGEPVTVTSKLVDVLEKFDISGDQAITIFGRLNKNVGAYASTAKNAAKFQKDFGISLVDGNGKIVDTTELLARSADFWNSNATATQKSTTLTKLYGKSWQTLIPLFSQGRKGIGAELKDAISISPQDIANIAKYTVAQRNFADAMGDLQVKVGIGVMPLLTEGMTEFGNWISKNEGAIVSFVKGAAQGVKEIAGVVISVGKGLADIWGAIPPDFRKLLIGGLVANKVLKMTIGFDPIDIVRKSVTGALGQLFSRGSPANPMFTKEIGLGGAGGLPGAGGGIAGKVLPALGIVASIAAPIVAAIEISNQSTDQAKGIEADQLAWLKTQPKRADLVSGLAAIDTGIAEIRSNPLNVLVQGEALQRLEAMRATQVAELAKIDSLKPYLVTIAQAAANGQQTINYIAGERALGGGGIVTTPTRPRSVRGNSDVDNANLTPRQGIEKNRESRITILNRVTTSHRDTSSAKVTHTRYGPTPAEAGA